MASPIVNPEVPYTGEIPGGLQLGRMCRIQGVTHPDADRFNINLNLGPSSSNDTALHLSVRLNQGYIARNSYKNGAWQDEQGSGTLPIGQAQSWEIIILVDQNDYKIAVNGQHFCEFPHRLPFNRVTHLLIDGQVSITLISWEGISGIASSESSTISSQLNAEGPQGIPPQQFGVPQGGYGAPGGYGPPGGGYGAPPSGYMPPAPPGAQQESGFDNFLEQAQSVLAGAIKSGAAEKLLGGLLSSGGPQQGQQGQGYAPQNAQYGQYPQPPQQQQQQQHSGGPLENLLSGFLSSGSHQQPQQQAHGPQIGGGDSIGGLGSMSGILQNFAGQILQPKDGNQRQNY